MKKRKLGNNGPQVSAIGLGCYELTGPFGDVDSSHAIALIRRAIELGVTFIDTADIYGPFTNEEIVGRAIKDQRGKVFLCTKFGQEPLPQRGSLPARAVATRINGKPDYVRSACEASLKRLNVDHIDLYIQHRVDPEVPVEETIGAIAQLIRQGKVLHYGLSEAAPATIRRAHAVHPLTALQSEYSLWTRDPEDEVLSILQELGAGFIAFSPLGRGFLAGTLRNLAELAPDDTRRANPRFEEKHFQKNQDLLAPLCDFAIEVGISPAQLALAWLLSRGEYIVPIPGTRRLSYLEQNAAAVEVILSDDLISRIDRLMIKGVASGPRYGEADLRRTNR